MMERGTDSQLEVEVSTGLQVAPQPDGGKYYMGGGGYDHPPFVPPDQPNQSQAKGPRRFRAVWVLAVIAAVCMGVGLGVGLHKSNISRSSPLPLHVSLLSAPSVTYFFCLNSHASTASSEASNAPVTIIQASGVTSIASNPLQQSNSPTISSASPYPAKTLISPSAPRLRNTALISPSPSQISSNDKGSSLCSLINGTTCRTAYSQYNNTYLYQARTWYILPSGADPLANGLFSSAKNGCAAIFGCRSGTDYAVGMTGARIKAAFDNLFQNPNDHVAICGSSYLNNGCHVTVNECENCEPAVPCGSLSAEDTARDYPCYT